LAQDKLILTKKGGKFMAVSAEHVFKPGEKIPTSGVYKVTHDPKHTIDHEVICLFGKKLPPCNECGNNARFTLIRAAHYIETQKYFKT
jgi:hypothetical protein